jgi:hypothetical protein
MTITSGKFFSLGLIGALLVALVPSVWALTPIEVAKLIASDGASNDLFGTSVAVDGDTALIGASDDDNGDHSGSAYVFTRSAGVWTEQAKLTASDGATYDNFGYAISVDGDTALIGAFGDDDNGENSGSAYIFTRNAGVWTEQAKLTASDGANGDYFGDSVAMDGDTALIGALFDYDIGPDSGSAYVFSLFSETIAIGSFDIYREGSFETTNLELYFTSDEEPFQDDMAALYLWGLTSTDIGKTFTFSSGTEFDKAVGYLTDGIDGWVVWLAVNYGEGKRESSVFAGDIGAVNGFDFAGSTISSISVTLNSLEPFSATVDINSIPVPAALTIDIKPGKEPNIINLKSGGFISVAILTEGEFDALQVDPDTAKFGPSEAIAERYKVKDVDHDGDADLHLKFRIKETGIACEDTQATLVGELYDGSDIMGTDSIKTVGCKPKKCDKKKHHNKHHGDRDNNKWNHGKSHEKKQHNKHHDDDHHEGHERR